MAEGKPATNIVKTINDYFRLPGESLKDFAAQLKQLSPEDKLELAGGIQDGSLTY